MRRLAIVPPGRRRRTIGRAVRPLLVAMAVALLVVGNAIAPRGAAAAASTPSLTLQAQPAWVDPSAPTTVTVTVANAPAGARVRQILHDRLKIERDLLHNMAAGKSLTRQVMTAPDTAVPSGTTVTVSLTVRLTLLGNANHLSESFQGGDGVYPLELSLVDRGGRALGAGFVTFLLLAPAPTSQTAADGLGVGLVLPVGDRPTVSPDGRRALSSKQRQAITDLLDVLEGPAGTLGGTPYPVTLAPVPDTVATLDATEKKLLLRLGAATAAIGRQLLVGPYVPIDEPSLLGDGRLRNLLNELIDDGRRTNAQAVDQGATVDSSIWIADPDLDAAALQPLRDHQLTKLLVPTSALAPARTAATATAPFKLSDDATGTMRGIALDGDLQDELGNPDQRLGVQQALADLVLIANQDSGTGRGVALVPPAGWQPAAATLRALLDGLGQAPAILRPVTVTSLFSSAGTGLPSRRLVGKSSTPSRYIDALASSDGVVAAYQGAIAPNAATESPEARQRLEDLDLRRKVTAYEGFDLATQQRYLDRIKAAARTDLARITLPSNQKITITARTAKVPLTIRNGTGLPVTVRVVAEGSERVKFEGGQDQTVTLVGDTTPIDLRVHVRTSGDIPIRIRVLTPDQQLEIATSQVTVRSTAVSGVGLVLTIGALGFLLLWWARHWHHNRRPPRGRHARPRGKRARAT